MAIMFFDFSKAFDGLEWIFMTESFKKFGFKNDFIKWVKNVYKIMDVFQKLLISKEEFVRAVHFQPFYL